jgi:hypothetical protein
MDEDLTTMAVFVDEILNPTLPRTLKADERTE